MNERNVPEVRFRGFSGAWERKSLGYFGSVSMNKRIYKHQTTDRGDIPFYKIGTFGKKADSFITKELFQEYKTKYPYPKLGDILISASGSIGKTVVYKGKDEYYQDSNIVWLNHSDDIINPFLLQFYIFVKWSGLEGSTIKRLYSKNILETEICTPYVAEQTKIGDFFKNLDNLITQNQKKYDKLVNMKKACLDKMFPKDGADTPEVRFRGFSGEWEAKEVHEIVDEIATGKSKFISHIAKTDSTPFPILGSTSIIGYSDAFDYSGDFILTARVGANAGDLYRYTGNVKISDNTVFINGKNIDYLFYSLISKGLKQLVFGTGQPLIKASELNFLLILLPINELEQLKIGSFFQNLDTLITAQKTKLEKLKNIKKACLDKMFI